MIVEFREREGLGSDVKICYSDDKTGCSGYVELSWIIVQKSARHEGEKAGWLQCRPEDRRCCGV